LIVLYLQLDTFVLLPLPTYSTFSSFQTHVEHPQTSLTHNPSTRGNPLQPPTLLIARHQFDKYLVHCVSIKLGIDGYADLFQLSLTLHLPLSSIQWSDGPDSPFSNALFMGTASSPPWRSC